MIVTYDPFRRSRQRISYVDAVAGARKTRTEVERAVKRALNNGEPTMFVMPTLRLIAENIEFAYECGAYESLIRDITSGDDALELVEHERVRSAIIEYLKDDISRGHLLFITHAAFWNITDWPDQARDYHLVFDEAPDVLLTRSPFYLRYNAFALTSWLRTRPADNDYDFVLPKEGKDADDPYKWLKLRASKKAHERDQIFKMMGDIPLWLLQDAALFTDRKAWQAMIGEGPNTYNRGRVTISGFRRPETFAQFRSATILSALFQHTMAYHIWSQLGVKFTRARNGHQRTQLGSRRLKIYWLFDQGWSKKTRNRSGGIENVLHLIKRSKVIDPNKSVCVLVNKDDGSEEDPARVTKIFGNAVMLPHKSLGLNTWREETQLIYLPALNSATPDIIWIQKALKIDADTQRIARAGQDAYQTMMRLSLREPTATDDITIVVVDRDVAMWLKNWFEPQAQVEVNEIDSRGVISRKRQRGRKTLNDEPMSVAERVRRHRERKANLKLVVDNDE